MYLQKKEHLLGYLTAKNRGPRPNHLVDMSSMFTILCLWAISMVKYSTCQTSEWVLFSFLCRNCIIYYYHFHFRWKSEGKIVFILNILKWQQLDDVLNDKKCFILNVGYFAPLPFPDIKLSSDLNSLFHLNVGTLGINSPNKCSIVVIGGKYLEKVDEVMRMVDKITDDIAWMPSAVFLMAKKRGQVAVLQIT